MNQNIPSDLRQYLNEIAEKLRSGHAAVMVGAGFSKNAIKGNPAIKDPPLWRELGDAFYEKLYGRQPGPEEHYLNILKLADEVKAKFNRPVLNNLLKEQIRDLDFEPSELHIKLLELPWTDVFTTNYDTLLERASEKVTSQKFDIVIDKDDLVYSNKPRIVKLHGSFPSKRPFIITEEDYRKYPKDFAPFVNTVQQSLLENALCLIGFSGDDPNFLQWIGWIRDNLGDDNASKIYLIGLFDLSDAQKKLLEKRNIAVIDLADCIEERDHRKALLFFIEFLSSAIQDENLLDWANKEEQRFPKFENDIIAQLKLILENWKTHREKYPNWIILRDDQRNVLWRNTEPWLLFNKINELDMPDNIRFLYELNWRFEKCLYPVCSELVPIYKKTIENFNPFPEIIIIENSIILKDIENERIQSELRQKWLELSMAILRFYREEGLNEDWRVINERLQKCYSFLSPTMQARLAYERCLFNIFSFNISAVRKEVEEWPVNDSLPHWEAKRAGILAEIGDISEAEQILDKALNRIRKKLNLSPISNDYQLGSEEAYVMFLTYYIKQSLLHQEKKVISIEKIKKIFEEEYEKSSPDKIENIPDFEYHKIIKTEMNRNITWEELYIKKDKPEYYQIWKKYKKKAINREGEEAKANFEKRWQFLKQFEIAPWSEFKFFEILLQREFVLFSQNSKFEFDIGRAVNVHNSMDLNKEVLTAYSFLRYCEEAGLPFKISNATYSKNAAEGAIKRISNYSSHWAFATLLRIGDTNIIDSMFNRESIYKIDVKQIDKLILSYISIFKNARSEIETGVLLKNDYLRIAILRMIPEILSRLCVKCSDEVRYNLLTVLRDVYSSNQLQIFRGTANLMKRLIISYSKLKLYALIPDLLTFPILTNLNPSMEDEFPDPFGFVIIKIDEIHERIKLKISDNIINELIQNSSSANEKRKRSIWRLDMLYDLKLLNNDQIERFSSVLWSLTDEKTGFPIFTGLYNFSFLNLPHPPEIDPISLFEKYILNKNFPIQGNGIAIGFSGGHISLFYELLSGTKTTYNNFGVNWSEEDVSILLNKMINWWGTDNHYLKQVDTNRSFLSTRDEFRYRFNYIVPIMADIIAPNLSFEGSKNYIDEVFRLIREFNEYDIPSLRAKAACIHLNPEIKDQTILEIQDAIDSENHSQIVDALNAILVVLYSTNLSFFSKDEIYELIDLISQQIRWRREISIDSALKAFSSIVEKTPDYLDNKILLNVLAGLKRLLADNLISKSEKKTNIDLALSNRKNAAHLAYTLYQYYKKQQIQVPEVIINWETKCKDPNEFAEIRNEWVNF